MSETIEISRELAENIANYMEGSASGMVNQWHKELLALIAAPVVGRQEPIGFVSYIGNGFIRVRCSAPPPLESPLYTSSLATVSVLVLPDRIDWKGIWPSPNLTAAEHIADTWNACLDKVKELNQ